MGAHRLNKVVELDEGMPSVSFCYALTCDADSAYHDMACVSVSLLRRVHPYNPIVLLLDEHTEPALVRCRARILGLVDEVVGVWTGMRKPVERSRVLKVTMREHVSGDFVFLDVDTAVVGTLDRIYSGRPALAAAPDLLGRSEPPPPPAFARQHYARLGWQVHLPHYFNSGVVYWADTPETHRFGEEYHRRWRMIYESSGDHRDQPAFNSAVHATGLPVRVLRHRYNAMIEASPHLALGAHVLHFWTEGGLPREGTLLRYLLDHYRTTGQIDWRLVDRAARFGSAWVDDNGQMIRPWLSHQLGAIRDNAEHWLGRYIKAVKWNLPGQAHRRASHASRPVAAPDPATPRIVARPCSSQQAPVSVLIPVYNAERFVSRAIASVLKQSHDAFELLLLDDGSSDGSLRILRQFERCDGRIRVISRPNTGICGALNDLIAEASFPLLARMDSDDVCVPDRLEKQVRFMQSHADCVVLGGAVQLIDAAELPICELHQPLQHDQIEAELLSGVGGAIVHPTAMMRRDAVQRIGGYREETRDAEDLDLFLRLAEVGRLANLPDVLLRYRQHPGSINATRHERQRQLVDRIIREAHSRRGLTVSAGWTTPPSGHLDPLKQMRIWVWAALKHRHLPTARKYAMSVLRSAPLSADSWRLMYCALRGR